MITTPIAMSALATQTAQPRGTSGGNAFGDLLSTAINQGRQVPNGQPLPTSSVNALAQAIMAALAQAQGGWNNGLSMPLLGGGAAPFRAQSLPNFSGAMAPRPPTTPVTPPPSPVATTATHAPYDAIIKKASQRYGVDEGLIRAVIQAESSFNPQAVSPVGAQGLMQLMPATAAELGVDHPFDPEENIMGGTLYLSRLLGRYQGDTRLALSAYNWGMGNLERQPENMPGETKRYVAKIMGELAGNRQQV